MAKFFIDRPVFAWVIALFIMLAGLLAIRVLPVAQYPTIAPPSVVITATYPGGTAKILDESVTSLIEQEMNGAEGLQYIESESQSNGTAQITVTFVPGTNPDLAAVDVQNRIKRVEPRLPQAVLQQQRGIGIHAPAGRRPDRPDHLAGRSRAGTGIVDGLALPGDRQRQSLLERLGQPLVRGVPGREKRSAQGEQITGLQAAGG